LRLSQCGMERRVDASYRADRQRLSIDPTPTAQVFVELVDDGGCEVAHQDVTETRLEVTLDDRCEIADGGRRPRGSTAGEPLIEECSDRRVCPDCRRDVGVRRQRLEFSQRI
jgi:hypothetical protein